MGELEIRLYGGYEHWSSSGCGVNERIWTYSVNYCGPTITKEGVRNSCNFFSVEVRGSEDFYDIIKMIDLKQYYSRNKNKKDLEKLNKKALSIARNVARLMKEKLIPEELREEVQIKEKVYDWKKTITEIINSRD